MKVYYVSSGIEACYNIRCLFPLQANGWDGDRTTLIENTPNPEKQMEGVKAADIVVFHRPQGEKKLKLARLLKSMGKKIVYDNDDTFKDLGGYKINSSNEFAEEFIKEADLVTCTTDTLKEEYSKINPNVVVLPNYIDPFYFDEPLKNKTDKVRIGIIGTIAMTDDFNVLKPILEHFKDDKRIQFVLLAFPPIGQDRIASETYKDVYAFFEDSNVEWHTAVPADEYYAKLNELRLDMTIISRADNYFNRCKSNLKFLETAMLEIPCICQSFSDGNGPYDTIPFTLHATDTESWITKINILVSDYKYRESLGKEAKEYVEQNYNIEDHAHLWNEAYQKLFTLQN